ncbi:hypothetical protein [Neolewinella agarilytica]|uniref:Outer membrane protein beta-barrel domain-containing protein n=1 Tax=Neolewinella agarilytica TaxID=478744 RepID=A0A1H9MM01_9BACT|nr:hypothetical protein [Neolewinella agarilytica]SER24581.1 hypothetical protein SAMN05444359_13010 [Neolewinella agarilytica]
MRFLCLLLFSALISTAATAQTNREIGVRATGIDNVSLLYKRQLASGNYMRYRLIFSNISLQTAGANTIARFNTSLAVGVEKRKPLAERLTLLYGLEPTLGLSVSSTTNFSSLTINAGLGYVIGVQYTLSDHFHIALETIPSVNVFMSVNSSVSQYGVLAGFSNNSLAVSGVYQFSK